MCRDICAKVCGCCFQGESAVLTGYSRRRIYGVAYPGLIKDDGTQVKGVLYRNVPQNAWLRLDRFEGGMYSRESVQVQLGSGVWVRAGTYIVKPAFWEKISDRMWDLSEFIRKNKEDFISVEFSSQFSL